MMATTTVDPGYPTEAQGDLPAFHSVDEEAAFWDTHDVTDLSELTEMGEQPADSEIAARLVVRLDPADREELNRQAERQGVEPAALVQHWVHERLQSRRAG
jgi:predicted HicB family RNase H-like nuclease